MKNFPIVLALACLSIVLTSCGEDFANPSITPSSQITKIEKSVDDFTALDITNEFNVFVTFSDTDQKVEVEANENLQEFIIVEQDGPRLKIKVKNNTSINGNETMNVYITTKKITDFNATGEANIQLQNEMTNGPVFVNLTGESSFSGKINLSKFEANLTGESTLNLSGNANNVKIILTGDSQAKDYEFVCNDLDINLTGDSQAFLSVMNTLNVNATGESVLHYKGTATIQSQNVTGEARIKKED